MHTSYNKGTTIRIKLKNGRIIIGKFFDHKSGKVLLEDGTIINLKNVSSMSIRKLDGKNKIIEGKMNNKYTPEQGKVFEKAITYVVKHFLRCKRDQKPVILHSIMIGYKMMELKQSKDLVIAGFLHDLVEDSDVSVQDIKRNFGTNVAKLVAAITMDLDIKDYKLRYNKLVKNVIKAGKGVILLKIVDGFDNLPYYQFVLNGKKRQELIWKHDFVINSLEKYMKNEKIFQKYKNLFKKLKKSRT